MSLKIFPKLTRVPYLFSVLCLALITLMAFQIHWIGMSKRLIEEQFDQKVNLAMGGAMTKFYSSRQGPLLPEKQVSCSPDNYLSLFPISLNDQKELKNYLREYMACYGIEEKYKAEIFDKNTHSFTGPYCYVIGTAEDCYNSYMLGVSFETKNEYLFDQMSPMILSSILIFMLLASVSFIILWSLVKQKRITDNNIDFFNNTAHELKTPLTNISLALKLLGMKHKAIRSDKYAQIIKSENAKLSSQIERILFLAKIENGEYALKKEEVNIKEIISEVAENMTLVVNERGGSIQLDMPAHNPLILGDRYHLSNVFRNLIDNALKYCDRTPLIQIRLSEDDKQLKVSVSDNGIGISPQDQSHIFEKFQRVNTGNVRRAKGFGIGLSYVKTIIEMHKGLVHVKSELNKGSEFQLFIPNA